uniref:ER-bound oxygenase mpaB/mpaB'/Rubber oxygenase catalytic domain-containing protein n=1 Tax=Alexandrium catenella TaxID=2925 RepID=A0A7S1RH83_ALECA
MTTDDMEVWDQRLTLRPPPYKGAMARLLEGLEVGDDIIDALPDAMVSPCTRHRGASSEMDGVEQLPEPEWVDWDLVRKGQALWSEHLGRAFLALTAALLQGFTIARFAEVLHRAGYAQSPLTSVNRYSATAFFLHDWFLYPLDDPESRARKGIYTVRCMHSYARRRSNELFSREAGEGIPLSQYDLGEVQLGFSVVCLSVMENELAMPKFACDEREAMVHVWRLIGWHLGIQDRFNVCTSVDDLEACFEDYMRWTPQRLRSCRESTHVLQRVAVEGFGTHLFLGQQYWKGFLAALQNVRGLDINYVRVKPLPGMMQFVRWRFLAVGRSAKLNAVMSHFITLMRETRRRRPKLADWIQVSVAPKVAAANDLVGWRLVSLAMRLAVASGAAASPHKAVQMLAAASTAVVLLLVALARRRRVRLALGGRS